jgi:hypothetical protein
MDSEAFSPRLAMWVHNSDTESWKLWLVPPTGVRDKLEFYKRVSTIIANHRAELAGIDASDTQMVVDTHPAMQGMKSFLRAEGLTNIAFSGNLFDGFYLPEGIILRSAL